MSVKIFYKPGYSSSFDESSDFVSQLKDAVRVEINTKKDAGMLGIEFLSRLNQYMKASLIEPFEIQVSRGPEISGIKVSRLAKKTRHEMLFSWALKETIQCQNSCEKKIEDLLTVVRK